MSADATMTPTAGEPGPDEVGRVRAAATLGGRLRGRGRRLASLALHEAWRLVGELGAVGPDDPIAARFAAVGRASCIAFPPGVRFGERFISIGESTLIGPHVTLAMGMYPDEPLQVAGGVVLHIGDRCVIGRGGSIVGRCSIVIEDDVTTAPNVYITDHDHAYSDIRIPIGRQWPIAEPVRIGAGSWLGTGVIVLPGASIGRHVTVAAGSVVRSAIPDFAVAAGSPAKVVRRHIEGQGWVPPVRRTAVAPEWWVLGELGER